MNIFQKIVYFFLEIQEKSLTKKLGKHLKTSSTNSTSKTIMSKNDTMTLTSQTEKNKELVKKNVEEIVKACDYNPYKLLAFIESKGTKVYKVENADKILQVIREDEGLICELKGIEALYLNLAINKGFSFTTKPMFIMREGDIDPYYMIHQFYKWYSLINNLPGYDYVSQKYFKLYLNAADNVNIANMNLDEMLGLKEAIARDQEATDFALKIAKEKEGSKKVLDKMKNDGGANV